MFSRIAVRAVRPVASVQVRFSATSALHEKEQAVERDYINRVERELIRNMLKKSELKIDPSQSSYKESLIVVLAKHNISATPEIIEDLLQWKNTFL